MSSAAVIVAAGSGTRFGEGLPKQFRELGGRPVLDWACAAFRKHPRIQQVIVVVAAHVAAEPPEWLGELADHVVEGGESRRESVGRGIAAVDRGVERILVHDGVRPFVSSALIERVWEAAAHGAVVPVIPVADALKEVGGGRVIRTLARDGLARAQTPQGFPAGLLRRVHREAERENEDAPDDAALCEARGEPVCAVGGDPHNLKITTPEDLAFAEWLLRAGRLTRG
ncbi:MAG: 2-C-methyl-D-erythritol 4-phosphate cytidylyltransferase [Gemmatimonadota bacterium]